MERSYKLELSKDVSRKGMNQNNSILLVKSFPEIIMIHCLLLGKRYEWSLATSNKFPFSELKITSLQ